MCFFFQQNRSICVNVIPLEPEADRKSMRLIFVRHRCVTIAMTASRTRVTCHSVKHEILPSSACRCSPGYDGMLCDEGVDDSALQPCRGGGVCRDLRMC